MDTRGCCMHHRSSVVQFLPCGQWPPQVCAASAAAAAATQPAGRSCAGTAAGTRRHHAGSCTCSAGVACAHGCCAPPVAAASSAPAACAAAASAPAPSGQGSSGAISSLPKPPGHPRCGGGGCGSASNCAPVASCAPARSAAGPPMTSASVMSSPSSAVTRTLSGPACGHVSCHVAPQPRASGVQGASADDRASSRATPPEPAALSTTSSALAPAKAEAIRSVTLPAGAHGTRRNATPSTPAWREVASLSKAAADKSKCGTSPQHQRLFDAALAAKAQGQASVTRTRSGCASLRQAEAQRGSVPPSAGTSDGTQRSSKQRPQGDSAPLDGPPLSSGEASATAATASAP